MSTLTTADRIAMYAGGGLVLLGTFVVGLLEMLLGAGHSVPSGEQIEHSPLVPLEIRAYVILAGLLIWGLYVIYKVIATTPKTPDVA